MNMFNAIHPARLAAFARKAAAGLLALALLTPAIAGAQSADPYKFEKKAYKPDGTPWSGPVNIGDTVKYVLSYKPGAANSGPVTIDDTLSANQSYVAPTQGPGWTWGTSPYAVGNHETYANSGFGPGTGSVKLTVTGLPAPVAGVGDGTIPIPILALNKVFGINHHTANAQISCWDINTLTPCAATASGGLFTPMTPQAVLRGNKFYYAAFAPGSSSSGPAVYACFDAAIPGACAATPLSETISQYGQVAGVVEDSTGRLLLVANSKVFCRTESAGVLSPCAGWPSGGAITSVTPTPATNISFGNNTYIIARNQRAYVHHGSSVVQCIDTTTGATCSGGLWSASAAGITIGSSGLGEVLVPIATSGSGDGGVCLITHGVPSPVVVKGCVDANGSPIGNGSLTGFPKETISAFQIPGTSKVLFPLHGTSGATPPVSCFDFAGGSAVPCSWTPPSTPVSGSTYGFAMDPSKPSTCVLALGHHNLLWRFDYVTGEVGCGTSTVSTPSIDQLYCNSAPDPAKFQWSNVTVGTASAAGMLTIKQGTTTATLTLVSGTTNYAMPSAIAPGYGPLTFSFVPASGAPASVDLVVGYTSDKNPEICYQAKISKCGPVFNDAVFKGSFNGAAINVAQKVDLGVAKGSECDPVPPQPVTCLSGDAKVTCGEKPGTYVITLTTTGAGGLAPDHVSITPTTPGVTIVGPQSSYAVIGGLVKITIAGANPGDVITFDMQGTKAGAGAVEGSDLCCNGTVKVTIPKDLPCEKPDISILKTGPKTCEPGKPCTFNVTVTNNGGPFNGNVLLWDAVTPNAWAVTSITPNVCGTSISTTPFGCVANLNLAAGQSMTFAVTMTAAFNDGKPAENCISAAFAPSWLTPKKAYTKAELAALFAKYGAVKPIGKSCWPVQPPVKSTVDVSKICDPAVYRKYALGQAIDALGWVSMCHIKVTTTGPQNGTLTVNDSLTGGGTIVSANSTTLPAWTCVGSGCSVSGPLLNQTSSVSNIDMLVAFPSMGNVSESANCAAVAVNGKEADKDCVKFTLDEPTISVTKVCDPAKHVWIGDLPPRPNMPPNGYVAMCHIKVSTTGPVVNPISVSEVLSGAGTVTYAGATDPWTCAPPMVPGNTPMNCTLPGNVMTGPSDTSIIDVKVTFTSAGALKDAKNCAAAAYGGKELAKSCDDFVIDAGTVSVEKKCEPAVYGKYPVGPAATGLGLHANCTITVTTTGPQSGTISVGDNLVGTGNVVNMNAPAPWTCATPNCSVNGAALNQVSSTTVIGAIAVFSNVGDALEAKNCAKVDVAGRPADESCTPIVVDKTGTLTVTKEAAYNGSHITNVSFPIAVTCGGVVTNASFADGTPYVQTNIPLGTACSVVEGAAPATGLCGKGQTEVWTTAYAPATPVTVTSGGAAIHVKNVLSCKPDKDGEIKIVKVCDPATPVEGPVPGKYQAICHITVNTTGPQSGPISVGENLTGGGTLGVATAPAPWACTGPNCTVDSSLLNQTSSTSVINVTVTFPSAGHVSEGKNCAGLEVDRQPAGESCTGFTVEPPKDTGKITVLKEALHNGHHITNQAFPIAVTCGGVTVNGSVSDGAPYVQTGLPVNAACTVVEGAVTPAAALCGQGQTATWITTYTPSTPVAASVAGGTITITNRLDCRPVNPPEGPLVISVTKTCSGFTELQNGGPWAGQCQVTVNVSGGPMPPFISIGEALHDTNLTRTPPVLLTGFQSADAWTCPPFGSGVPANTPLNCVIPGSSFPASGTSVVNFGVYLPRGIVAGEAENCVSASAFQTPTTPFAPPVASEQVCVPLPGEPPVSKGRLLVEKVATYNGQNLPQATYPMTVTCGSTVTPISVTAGSGPEIVGGIAPGTSCTIVEPTPSSAGLCGKGQIGTWATTFSPAVPIIVPVGDTIVTVTNMLRCEPVNPPVDSDMYVKKVVVSNAPGSVAGMVFDITSQCTNTTQPTGFAHFSDGQTVLFHHYEVGMSCTLSEVIPATTACGKGQNPVWTTTYSPSQTVALSASGETVTVTNTLDCEPIVEPVDSGLYVKKVVVNNAPGSVAGMVFDISDSCNSSQNPGFAHFTDGQTIIFKNYEAGVSCTFSEAPIPPTTACGKGMNPIWTTSYAPSQTVAMSPTGTLVTVTNTLDCNPVIPPADTGLKVKKVVVSNAPGSVEGLTFPISATCVTGTGANALDNSASHSLSHGQTQTYLPYMAGGSCTVTEGAMPATTACGKGMNPVWTTTYSPSQTMAMQPAGTLVTVTNTLDCEPVIIPVDTLKCDPATATNAGDLCRCRFDNMNQVSKTACECKPGFTLKAGQGCVRKVAEPRCDPATTVAKGGKCVCEYRNMVQTSASACACAKGFKFAVGKGCFRPEPVCGKNQNLVKGLCVNKPPVCGRNQVLLKGRCTDKPPVCGRNQVLVKGRCVNKEPVCRPPFKYDAKRRACVEQIQRCEPGQIRVRGKCIRIPKCGFGQIPVPGTGICVSIGGGGDRPKDPPRCNPAVKECG